jgi:hypothetical protein
MKARLSWQLWHRYMLDVSGQSPPALNRLAQLLLGRQQCG